MSKNETMVTYICPEHGDFKVHFYAPQFALPSAPCDKCGVESPVHFQQSGQGPSRRDPFGFIKGK